MLMSVWSLLSHWPLDDDGGRCAGGLEAASPPLCSFRLRCVFQ
uniref:Uncharacterized protein n=1 Tax=Arundo donax TaxID=35708 RepID=A0A0A9G8P2_ARUDO